jgi:spore germination cell wall hydrolase CwlJ-like protein
MAYAVHKEAGGEPLKGQRAVLDVIHNRMWQRKMSACEVVTERKQFSFYEATQEFKLEAKELTHFADIARMPRVLSGKVSHFHATYVKPRWSAGMKKAVKIGSHIFYIDKEKQE